MYFFKVVIPTLILSPEKDTYVHIDKSFIVLDSIF